MQLAKSFTPWLSLKLTGSAAYVRTNYLNSASPGLTDECLVALQRSTEWEKSRQWWDHNKRPSICVCCKRLT